MREMEDQYTNSAINVPSNTINIILEFTQPETKQVNENGVLPEETGDQLVQVAYCSSVSNNNPDVTAEISSTAGSEFSTTDNVTRKTSTSNVVEQIKKIVAERNSPSSNSMESSILNVQQPSISNPQQPSISTPQEPSISNPQEFSVISNPQQQAISNAQVCTPSSFNLYIQKKEVVQRTLNIQTQAVCQEETANKKQQKVKEITSVNNNYCHKTVEATQCSQITNSTKLALLNFLKKKYTGSINVANAETEGENADPEVQIVSTIGQESNGSGKEGTCSDETCNAENDVVKIATSTVSQEIAPITESSCTNPAQLSQNSDNLPGGQLTAAQSDNADQPLINQSDVSMMNTDIDKERKKDDNNSSILTKG